MELCHTSSASIWGTVEYYVKLSLLPNTSDQSVKPLFLFRFASFDVLIYSSFKIQSLPREVQPLKLSVNLDLYKYPFFLRTVPVVSSIVISLLQKIGENCVFVCIVCIFFPDKCLSLQLIFWLSASENSLVKY